MNMKNVIRINAITHNKPDIDKFYTGILEWYYPGAPHEEEEIVCTEYFVNGKRHREDGPAVETSSLKEWWLDGIQYGNTYKLIIVTNIIILDSWLGKYDLNWYKILDKDSLKIVPGIPGLFV